MTHLLHPSIVFSSLSQHVTTPPLRRLLYKMITVIVECGQEQQLVDMRRMIVPTCQVRCHTQTQMTQVITGPRSRVIQQQHPSQRLHSLTIQTTGFPGHFIRGNSIQIIEPQQRIDEAIQNERRRRSWILLVPSTDKRIINYTV